MSGLSDLVAAARARALPAPAPTPLSTAPEPAPITGPGAVAAYDPSGSGGGGEFVTGREIASVAAKLGRSKSDDKQTVGRAMLKALRGEVWAGDGHRNSTMYQIAAELVEAYPNLDPCSVTLAFSAAISNAQINGSKYTEEKLTSALERVQEERGNRIKMIQALGGLGIEAGQEPAPWPTEPVPGAAPTDPRAAELNAAGFKTLIVRANGDFYLRTPDRGTYDWKLSSDQDLRLKMGDLFGIDNSTVVTHQDGEYVGVPKICEVYARMADRIVFDYSSPSTTFALATSTLHVGLPADPPEPAHDARVEAWITELAGGSEKDRDELYDWIASTTREHIHRPAAALVISGAKDAGKTLFAIAVAGTWGVLPVKLANAVERFNGALLYSPFWHADERMPEEMTEACFRETVPERTRLIEPKGREKVEHHGCGRLMFTINSVDDLHVGTAKGPDAVDAVAGRIAFFDCAGRRAQLALAHDALRLPYSHDLDLPAIVRHLRYIQVNIKPREQRFLGARLDGTAARALVVTQSARRSELFVDALCDYLSDPKGWENGYAVASQYAMPGRAFPVVTKDGRLYAWPSELAGRLGAKGTRDLDALFLGTARTQIRFDLFRGSYREIDLERIVALRPDIRGDLIATVSQDTKKRT